MKNNFYRVVFDGKVSVTVASSPDEIKAKAEVSEIVEITRADFVRTLMNRYPELDTLIRDCCLLNADFTIKQIS